MRPVVSVQAAGDSAVVHHLPPGSRLEFGSCRCGRCPYHLALAGQPPVSGLLAADRDHWRLSNHGPTDLLVADLERPYDSVTVVVGRRGLTVPFELARVSAAGRPVLTVFGPEPGAPAPPLAGCPALQARQTASLLNPGTTYFAVLVALCEPRLRPTRASAPLPLPTSAELAARLRQRGLSVSARAVDSHIDYLIDKLRLRDRRTGHRPDRAWRKETLVTAAIRRGLVAQEHLPTLV